MELECPSADLHGGEAVPQAGGGRDPLPGQPPDRRPRRAGHGAGRRHRPQDRADLAAAAAGPSSWSSRGGGERALSQRGGDSAGERRVCSARTSHLAPTAPSSPPGVVRLSHAGGEAWAGPGDCGAHSGWADRGQLMILRSAAAVERGSEKRAVERAVKGIERLWKHTGKCSRTHREMQ